MRRHAKESSVCMCLEAKEMVWYGMVCMLCETEEIGQNRNNTLLILMLTNLPRQTNWYVKS